MMFKAFSETQLPAILTIAMSLQRSIRWLFMFLASFVILLILTGYKLSLVNTGQGTIKRSIRGKFFYESIHVLSGFYHRYFRHVTYRAVYRIFAKGWRTWSMSKRGGSIGKNGTSNFTNASE